MTSLGEKIKEKHPITNYDYNSQNVRDRGVLS